MDAGVENITTSFDVTWGGPMDVDFTHPKQYEAAKDNLPKSVWKCPRCDSQHIQRLAILHGMGTAALDATSAGAGIGSRGIGIGGATASGTLKSSLASQLAPPEKPEQPAATGATVGAALGFFIGFAGCCSGITQNSTDGSALLLLPFVLPPVLALIGAGISYCAASDSYELELTTYEEKLQEWERSFLCMRCGERFEMPPA